MKYLRSILLIDDDYATNYLHQIFFEETERVEDIHTSNNVDDALKTIEERIKENKYFDIIFIDINMPSKNGWDFLDAYEKLVTNQEESATIIMLSTSEYHRDIAKSKDYPIISEYRTKPMTETIANEIIDTYSKVSK